MADFILFASLLIALAFFFGQLVYAQALYAGKEGGYFSDIYAYMQEMQGIDSGYSFPYPVFFLTGRFFDLFLTIEMAVTLAEVLFNSLAVLIVILHVENMTVPSKLHHNNAVKNVSFDVRAGEIVCIAGIDGNGQTELVYGLSGLENCTTGKITLSGKDITHASIRERSTSGMSHIPEDRHKHGLVMDYSLAYNLVLQRYFEPQFSTKTGFLKKAAINAYADKLIEQYDIRSGQGAPTIARSMSGGNQQKAIIAREIDKKIPKNHLHRATTTKNYYYYYCYCCYCYCCCSNHRNRCRHWLSGDENETF